jgi:hypothetical protein
VTVVIQKPGLVSWFASVVADQKASLAGAIQFGIRDESSL